MKKLLLFFALLLMGGSLFAKPATFAVEASIGSGTVEDKGGAIRERDLQNKQGKKKGLILYYQVGTEWQTVKLVVAAAKGTFCFRSSLDGKYECKSFKVNGEEQLSAPIFIERSNVKTPERFKVKSDSGKMELVLQIRKVESAE